MAWQSIWSCLWIAMMLAMFDWRDFWVAVYAVPKLETASVRDADASSLVAAIP